MVQAVLENAYAYAWGVILNYAAPEVLPNIQDAELVVDQPTRNAGPEATFVAMVHDACHIYAESKGIGDTGRRGQWHNRQFVGIANSLGFPMWGHNDPTYGAARLGYDMALRPSTELAITHLREGLVVVTNPEIQERWTGDPSRWPIPMCRTRRITRPGKSGEPAVCGCGTTIRIALGAFHRAPIRCEQCGELFQLKGR